MTAHILPRFPHSSSHARALAARTRYAIPDDAPMRNPVGIVERINAYGRHAEVVKHWRPMLTSGPTVSVFTGGGDLDKLGKGRGAKVLAPSSPQAPGGVPAGRGECHPRKPYDTGGTGISPCFGG